jgi:hypothetical protein
MEILDEPPHEPHKDSPFQIPGQDPFQATPPLQATPPPAWDTLEEPPLEPIPISPNGNKQQSLAQERIRKRRPRRKPKRDDDFSSSTE